MAPHGERSEFSDVLDLLARLHRHKDRAYGDAWRKRGEVIAIFANLARKYDRLVIALAEEHTAAAEPLADTVGDLCVYAGKYLTWLADTQPAGFAAASAGLAAHAASAKRGPEALERVFAHLAAWEDASRLAPPAGIEEAWARANDAFRQLENGLMAQATPGSPDRELLTWSSKAALAWRLSDSTAWLLSGIAQRDPTQLSRLRDEVAAMDARA